MGEGHAGLLDPAGGEDAGNDFGGPQCDVLRRTLGQGFKVAFVV
ncbi:hypothetical protein ACWEWX_08035 [Streptomyces asiaticus]